MNPNLLVYIPGALANRRVTRTLEKCYLIFFPPSFLYNVSFETSRVILFHIRAADFNLEWPLYMLNG